MADQQFCLRWNNHQSTLISVFDSLLERGAMVDCTLAAEGQCLQAHKVVLSACSPYLETLLSQHYDKHPILLLKDVKFYELQAMMDYMYRGEVNVAQDKLGMFLKAAESLQIKGLSDSGGNEPPDTGGGTSSKRTSKAVPVTNIPRSGGGLTVERRRPQPQVSQVVDIPSDSGSRDGSESPSLRRKRRRRTSGDENTAEGDSSNTGDVSRTQPSSAPLSSDQVPMNGSADSNALGILSSLMDGTVETDNSVQEPGPSLGSSSQTQPSQRIREKLEPTSAEMIQPKAEYLETEENVEDLTLDDDDDTGMDAGPSQRQGAGYQWHMGDQSADEVFMAAQEAVGANRDAQGGTTRSQPGSRQQKNMDQVLSNPRLDKDRSAVQSTKHSEKNFSALRNKLNLLPCWTWKTGDVELAPGTAVYINNVDLLLMCRQHKASKRKLFISLLRALLTDDILSSKGLSVSGKLGTVRVPERILKAALAYATTVGEGDDFKTVNKIVSNLLQRFQSPRVRMSTPRIQNEQAAGPSTSNVVAEIIEEHAVETMYSSLGMFFTG
ncbi:longitudinals lacking protein, isoforms H/M/V-like isoform X4 [Thrips palmi]|uniref:Longitudinals lacking protein, isoforms H/M/V-like isoform X4 n=1 Tax=Thrips palmi TaxID=161013 RepID=A0A6P8ZWB2_THRPL|nr:longitudinals lacking protein, isoforms H/M/V-like isoform X4 [Thrips palmi]